MSETWLMKIVTTAWGIQTSHDGKFLKRYRPPSMDSQGKYQDDGCLITTDDINQAQEFPDAGAAFDLYRKQNGLRPDGHPNCPLRSYHVEIAEKRSFLGDHKEEQDQPLL